MTWKIERIGALLTESKIPALQPNTDRRIRVKLNVAGVCVISVSKKCAVDHEILLENRSHHQSG